MTQVPQAGAVPPQFASPQAPPQPGYPPQGAAPPAAPPPGGPPAAGAPVPPQPGVPPQGAAPPAASPPQPQGGFSPPPAVGQPGGPPPPGGAPPAAAPPQPQQPAAVPPQQQQAPAPQAPPPQQQTAPQTFQQPAAPGVGVAPQSPQAAAAGQSGGPAYYSTSVDTYESEAKDIKSGEGGDYWDKWPGSTDGSATQYCVRVAPPLTTDGRFARSVLKFFIPKNFQDPEGEKDVFIWPEGSEQQLGQQNPLLGALSRLKQKGVDESLLEKFEPQECHYTQGWFRDETFVNVTRTKPQWINLKKSIYNQTVQIVGTQGKIYGDLFNPDNGWDLLVTRSGKGKFGTKYTVSVVPCSWMNTSGPLHPDPAVAAEMKRQMKSLAEQFPVPSPEMLAEMDQAAQRLEAAFQHYGVNAFATSGGQVPPYAGGAAQFPQQQAPQGVGAPAQQFQTPGAQPGVPPQGAAPPAAAPAQPAAPAGYPPQGAAPGQPAYPPQGAAPPAAAPGQPGYPPQPAPPAGTPGQVPFEQGTADNSAVQQVPQETTGGEGSQLTPVHTLESAQQLVQIWGLQPDWVTSISDDGYWCTVQIPAGQENAGEYHYSLIEDLGKKGELKDRPKMWKSESTRGIKRHITGLLKKRGVVREEQQQPPPTPVSEPTMPTANAAPPQQPQPAPPDAAPPQPQTQQQAPAPPQAAPPVPPAEAPPQPQQPAAAPPQAPQQQGTAAQPPGPAPGVQVENTGGGPPECYFDPNRPGETGFYVISPANPMTCTTCAWEESCKAAADTAAASQTQAPQPAA